MKAMIALLKRTYVFLFEFFAYTVFDKVSSFRHFLVLVVLLGSAIGIALWSHILTNWGYQTLQAFSTFVAFLVGGTVLSIVLLFSLHLLCKKLLNLIGEAAYALYMLTNEGHATIEVPKDRSGSGTILHEIEEDGEFHIGGQI